MFLFFDPMYFLFLLPGIALAIWAQWKVQSAFAAGSRIRPRSGLSGAHAAHEIMQNAGVDNVGIEPSHGFLSDHYDPSAKMLRLSPDVYRGVSLAALGVAAHEAGHAIQDRQRYAPLVLRSILLPVANFGSQASWIILMLGFALSYGGVIPYGIGKWLIYAGIGLFATTVVFQVVNLPVEFDASRRARIALQESGLVTPDEDETVGKVLNAAALTYVAGTLTAILTLLYFLFRAGLLGGRSRDE